MAKDVKSLRIALALAVVTLAVYCPVTGFQFVSFDDPDYVTDNPHVKAGLTLASVQWAWSSEVMGNWHPVTMISHLVDCQLFGVRAWWPHLVNMVLHAANTVLLFVLLRRMTGAVWRSAIVAALFALHPLHVESVAWVSERKDVLSTLFWFLTIWAYARYAEERGAGSGKWRVFYGLSLVFFGLGLMSKAMLVTAPFTLLLLDFWPLGRMKAPVTAGQSLPVARLERRRGGASVWRLVLEKIPFFAMSAALCVATFRVQKQIGAVVGLQGFTLGERLGNVMVSYGRYIERMLWPRHLAGLYLVRLGQWPRWEVALATLLLLSISGLVLWQGRRRPYLGMGWFWYLGTLVPVIGLVQVGNQAMADRYTYVPLIGLFVMVAWGGWELAGAWRLRRLAGGVTAAAVAACAVLTVRQEFHWKDTEAYNKRLLEETPDNYIAHNNLGVFYIKANRTKEALYHFEAAARENPKYAEAHYNLGTLFMTENRTEEAIAQLMAAVRVKPDYDEAHNRLGAIFLGQRRYEEAVEHFRAAGRLHPDYNHYFNLGKALGEAASVHHSAEETAETARMFQQALELNPESSDARHNLGVAWQELGLLCVSQKRMPEAERAFLELARLQPTNGDACCWLGNLNAAQNKLAEAIPFYLKALRLNPSDFRSEFNLARTLALQGKRAEAAEHYRQALRLNPNFAEAQQALKALESSTNPR
jgi:tetratricopeptide (TPR) repeat protein